jgi:H+/Cl- antiporter ClcA
VAGGILLPRLLLAQRRVHLSPVGFKVFNIDTNMLTLSGMAGFLTGVTRSPFTSVILIPEITNWRAVIFQPILAGMVAIPLSTLDENHSLYDHLNVEYTRDLNNRDSIKIILHVSESGPKKTTKL